MENEKNDNIKTNNVLGKLELPSNDSYYEGLYNDLPKEVVELLMKTHPLMDEGQGEKMAERFITKHTRQLEAEEVKAIRNRSLLNNEQELQKTQISPLPLALKEEPFIQKPLKSMSKQEQKDDFEDDLIKLVKHKPKGYGVQDTEEKRNTPIQTKAPIKKKEAMSNPKEYPVSKSSKQSLTNKQTNLEENELSIKNREEFKKKKPVRKDSSERKRVRKDYSDVDLNKMTTSQNLNEFFESDVLDSDKKLILPGGRKMAVTVMAVGVLIFGILAVRTVSLTGKLQKANAEITDLSGAKEENNQLKLQMLSMEEELKNYKGENTSEQNNGENAQNPSTNGQTSTETIDPNSFDTYTVVDGDRIWDISAKVYGNGAYYKRILDANAMTEDSILKIGQQLKIPKIQ